jgi:hypothetical protein
METQTEPNIKSVSSVATGLNIIKPIAHADTLTSVPKQKKLILNSRKIEIKKLKDKYKD